MELKVLIEKLVEKAGSQKKIDPQIIMEYVKDDDDYIEVTKNLQNEGISVVCEKNNNKNNSLLTNISHDENVIYEKEPDSLSLSTEEMNNEDFFNIKDIPSDIKIDDPVRMYLKEIGQIPLFTLEEEQKQSRLVFLGKKAKNKLELYKKKELNLTKDEISNFEKIIKQAEIAKEKIVEANYRLVVSVAKRYIGRGLLFLDLIQEGNMGLMRAVDKFDYRKGFKFSTYAHSWVMQSITRAVADQARTIRVPVHIVETMNKMFRVQRQLKQELGREPTITELSQHIGIEEEKIRNIQKIEKKPISLEAPVGEEDDSSLGDFVSDPDALSPHDYMVQEIIKNALFEVLEDTLTDREEKVIRMRYGLIDGKIHTLEEVGNAFGVTRERIRQIEAKALRRLRTPARQNRLKFLYNKVFKK